MRLIFKHIKIKNFLSLGSIDVDLNDLGYVAISGVNNNTEDSAKSNGSGKSSLLEALIWNLTGDTLRGTKDVVNRFTSGGTCVELTFMADSNNYKVVRYKDDIDYGTNLKIYINGEDRSGKGIRDTQKILEEILPDIDTNLLGSVIILGQGLPQRFTNNTPSGRKEVLEKLSKSDFMIDDIKNRLSDRKNLLSTELRKYEDIVLGLENQKSVVETNIEQITIQLNNIPVIDYDNEIVNAENEYSLAQSNIMESQYLEVQDKLNEVRNAYRTYDLECKNELSELDASYSDTLKQARERVTEAKLKIDFIQDEIKKLENIKDVCPTCGQKLPNVHKVDTSSLYSDLNSWIESKDSAERELSIIDEKLAKLKSETKDKQEKKKSELESIGIQIRKDFDLIEEQYKKSKEIAEERRKSLEKLKADRELYQYKFSELNTSLGSMKTQIKDISDKILYNNIEKERTKSHLDVVNKMTTIATRDFRGFLLSEIIEFINKRAKEYSQEVFGTNKLDFYLNGNNIEISYCDKSYECLSGGEKQRLDIIIQFAIRDMLVQYLDFSSNLLALDEVFDNLDSIGCQKIIDLISQKLNDIESIFVITHHTEDLLIPCDREWTIVKNSQGVSELQ